MPPQSHKTQSRKEKLIRFTIPAILVLYLTWLAFRSTFVCNHHYFQHSLNIPKIVDAKVEQFTVKNKQVALEAHIMSKCPDAKDCLQLLVVPAMVQISDKVDFKLSYIGK